MAAGFPECIGSDRHEYTSLQVTVFTLSKAIVAALEDEGACNMHHLARGSMTHEDNMKRYIRRTCTMPTTRTFQQPSACFNKLCVAGVQRFPEMEELEKKVS